MREQFEKGLKSDCLPIYGHKVERVGKDEKVPTGIFYQDGQVNMLFHAYMLGYSHGRIAYM